MTEKELHILIDVLYKKHKTDIDKFLVKDAISEESDRATEFGSDFGFVSKDTLREIDRLTDEVFRLNNAVYSYDSNVGNSIVSQVRYNRDQISSTIAEISDLKYRIKELEYQNKTLQSKLEGLLNEKSK